MNSFLNQGRCRVCGQIFCCLKHQQEHERVEHDEYADWLDMLPALCQRCYRTIYNVRDMKGNCVLFNTQHTLTAAQQLINLGTPKRSSRKRTLVESVDDQLHSTSVIQDTPIELRIKATACQKLKKENMRPNVILIDINEITNSDDLINTVFSPQFNISEKILSGHVKSSTPLYDEKENLPVIAVFEKSDMSMYKTPETIQSSSLIVVSALKKSTPREGIIKCNSKTKKPNSRKVTFDVAKTPEIEGMEVSVYGTPEAEIPYFDKDLKNKSQQLTISLEKVKTDENSEVEISIYGTFDNEPIMESDKEVEQGQDCAAVVDVVKSVKLAVTGIPKMIFNACGWSMRVIRRPKRKNDDSLMCSVKPKLSRHSSLRRRPIASHWVSLTGSSLVRRPLSAYYSRCTESKNAYD